MAINFPASPTAGQVLIPTTATGSGPIWVYRNGAWRRNIGTALRANKIVNPAMQISQENGNTAFTIAGTYYPADQWINSGGSPFGSQRISAITPRGSKYRMRITVLTVVVGQSLVFFQNIEGNRIIDLNYGKASALYSVFRFGVNGPAGTYTAAIRDNSGTAAFIMPFTINNYIDTEFSFAVPPCTIGTWPSDNSTSVRINITPCTNTGISTVNTWTNSNSYTLLGQSGIGGTLNSTFDLFDVGWYADLNMTGVAPEFQVPLFEDDLQDCLRYWYPAYRFDGVVNSATQGYGWCAHYVPMRISPAYALVGTLRGYDAFVAPNISAITNYNINTEYGALLITSGTTMQIGRPYKTLVDGQTANYIAVNARM